LVMLYTCTFVLKKVDEGTSIFHNKFIKKIPKECDLEDGT